jgi:hypothetical protein
MASSNTDLKKGVVGNLGAKAPCRVCTTANIDLEGLQTINGIVVEENDRVLVRLQTDQTENGIYIASTSAWQRAVDFDDSLDGVPGSLVFVNEGSGIAELSARTLWSVSCNDFPINFGTSQITFTFFAIADDIGIYLASDNNLSDVQDPSQCRTNLGLVIGTDVQAFNSNLNTLITSTLGDLIYSSGLNTLAKLPGNTTTQRRFLRQVGSGLASAAPAWDTLLAADVPTKSGATVQVQRTVTGAVATTTTQIPYDDTIPQNTEGAEVMSLPITPTSATNLLKIEVVCNLANSSGATACTAALFQDSNLNAIAASGGEGSAAGQPFQVCFTFFMTAGTVSSTTFRVRVGPGGATTLTFNGSGGGRRYGGVMASSLTITEIQA